MVRNMSKSTITPISDHLKAHLKKLSLQQVEEVMNYCIAVLDNNYYYEDKGEDEHATKEYES